MVSSASGWKDGQREWAMEHEAAKGLEHLAATGALPESLAELRSELEGQREEGNDVDLFFEVPVAARRLTC